MKNLLLEPVKYKIEDTLWGTWMWHLAANGQLYEEFTSYHNILGVPLVHYTYGRNPETGKWKPACGCIAMGRVAVGIVAVGQAAIGMIAVGQLAIGVLFGLGQASTGMLAIGQLAIGVAFGLGQIVTGYTAIGQCAVGRFVLAQIGLGEHVIDIRTASAIAQDHFRWLLGK
jgi:hypothetical protein